MRECIRKKQENAMGTIRNNIRQNELNRVRKSSKYSIVILI